MTEATSVEAAARLAERGMAESNGALRLSGVSKAFPGVQALSDVGLICQPGMVHALVGENGSGKSTLVKVACGVLNPDSGSVRIGDTELTEASPLAVRQLGLHAAYQDTSLVGELTVIENVMLSLTGTPGFSGRLRPQHAASLLETYGLDLPLHTRVSRISPAMRQLLEIVRALIQRPKVLLLDEPTATLDSDRIKMLERLVAEARDSGTAVLYISHRLEEVERLADEVTILRDGVVQGRYPSGKWSVEEVVNLMVGAPIDLSFPEKAEHLDEAPDVLDVRGLAGEGFGPVDLRVRRGEIVGIAGAEGNGQREVLRALAGVQKAEGETALNGSVVDINSPSASLKAGIRFLSGDRMAESVFADMPVMANSTILISEQLGPLQTVSREREKRTYAEAAEALGIVAASPDQPANELSGGNQQKAVMARALLDPADLLVVDEPTQGVDAKSRVDIYRALRNQAEDGAGVLVNSSDSLELAELCDRVFVLSRGLVTKELSGSELTESNIVHSFVATGGTDTREAEEAPSRLRSIPSVIAAPWFPLTALLVMILVVGGYTASKSSVFLDEPNLGALLTLSLPLIIVAVGQQLVLLSRGFDISVGAMMSLSVVFASVSMTSDSIIGLLPGVLLILALGFVVGLTNGFVVRILNVHPIIATIGMLGILSGVALIIRPEPEGIISLKLAEVVLYQVGFVPVSFVVVAVLAIIAQVMLMRTGGGLKLRAIGFDERSARRLGVNVTRTKIGAFVGCSILAGIAGLYLGAQTGVGSANIGDSYALLSLAAAVIGGASLTGGQGSFIGCVIAGVFLSLLVNITPLLQISPAYSELITGALTLLAVAAYTLNRRIAR